MFEDKGKKGLYKCRICSQKVFLQLILNVIQTRAELVVKLRAGLPLLLRFEHICDTMSSGYDN